MKGLLTYRAGSERLKSARSKKEFLKLSQSSTCEVLSLN